jgi:hypothetical protein
MKHVLVDCVDVADVRQNFYNVNIYYDLFTNVAGDTILKLLNEIDYITYVLNIWFYLFDISFICTFYPFVL